MKSWFITGASSGIGRSVTEKLLERGDRVAATVRRPDALDDVRAAHGEQLHVVRSQKAAALGDSSDAAPA